MTGIVYKRCEEIITFLEEKGFNDQMTSFDIEHAIKRVAGFNRGTIDQYKKALVEFEFLLLINSRIYEKVKK